VIFNDNQLHYLCTKLTPPMITPFQPEQVRRTESGAPAISSGLSSFGYDIQLADTGLNRFIHPQTDFPYPPGSALARIIDPKEFDVKSCLLHQSVERDHTGAFYAIPPRAYALGVSVETFDIPRHVLGICYCKSTYARCGLMVNTTPLEPGWRGQLVIEMANLTDLPMKVYANEGIAQVVFFEGDQPSVTYADRSGKYQDQKGIVTARI
jgi:dCTP deaminase